MKTLSVEGIVSNPELISFRSVTHRNVTELDKQVFAVYRVAMVDAFSKALRFIKSAITWEKDMLIEFVDTVVNEFPNWKPEDFFLFLDMAKNGIFRTKFEQTVDYPTLMGWVREYDHLKLRAIESQMVTYTAIEEKPQPKVSPEEVEQVLRDFYANAKRPKPESELSKRAEQPERWAHMKQAQLEYRQAMRQYAFDVEGAAAHPYRILAAEDEFRKANDEKEWIANRIFEVHGYRIEIE